MLYNYYFDIAALIANLFLLAIYIMRRTLRTRSNKLLFVLLVVAFFGSLFDVISCFCISYPDRYSVGFNYFICCGYLFFYNAMGILFFAYIDSKTKIQSLYVPVRRYIRGILIVEFILIYSSRWTHFVAYFDENNVYSHGPLLPFLYFMAAMHLLASAVFFVREKRKFNRYQVMAIVSFIVAVFVGVMVQAVWPELLVGQFGNTLVLFFIYTSLENPVYYTYRATTCYNRQGFQEIIKSKLRNKNDINIFAFAIREIENIRESYSLKNIRRMSSVIAEFISTKYKENAFCMNEDKYFILVKDENEATRVSADMADFFARPIVAVDTKMKVSINTITVMHIDTSLAADSIENGITYTLDHNLGRMKDFSFDEVVSKIKRRHNISQLLKRAIEEDLFDVYYQPIMSVKSGKFQSAEALIRLIDNDFGFISPEEFIPIAENEGLINDIGDIVFEKVCKFIHENRVTTELGVKYIEINLSPLQCMDADIVGKFKAIMDKYDVIPQWINLEITETADIEQEAQLHKNIEEFHKLGMTFSLDDYGSGFASADYLFRFPVEIVKIDKGILWQAMKDVNAGVILMSTLNMLKSLGKEIVVEGVEDEEMVSLLVDNGCDFLQGYYYSKPVPVYQYVEFLKKNL